MHHVTLVMYLFIDQERNKKLNKREIEIKKIDKRKIKLKYKSLSIL